MPCSLKFACSWLGQFSLVYNVLKSAFFQNNFLFFFFAVDRALLARDVMWNRSWAMVSVGMGSVHLPSQPTKSEWKPHGQSQGKGPLHFILVDTPNAIRVFGLCRTLCYLMTCITSPLLKRPMLTCYKIASRESCLIPVDNKGKKNSVLV